MLALGGGGASTQHDAAALMRSAATIDRNDPEAPALMVADEVMCRCAWEDIFNDSKFLKQGRCSMVLVSFMWLPSAYGLWCTSIW